MTTTGTASRRPSAKHLVKRASALFDRVVPPPAGITVLIYHRVGGGSPSEVDLDAEMFDRQLEHLCEHHRILSIDEALTELASAEGWAAPAHDDQPRAAPDDDRRGVVLTFDDGTADFTDVVAPALARHGVPATLYVATQFVDEQIDFPWGAPPATWAGLRDALSSHVGLTIGSHTHAHWLLDRLDDHTLTSDLDRSIELIGEHLGVEARHFAYPKAVPPSAAAEIAVRRRFASAALAASRVNRPGHTDVHRLARTPVQRSDGFETFTLKADGGLRLEGELRMLTARVRYRGAEK